MLCKSFRNLVWTIARKIILMHKVYLILPVWFFLNCRFTHISKSYFTATWEIIRLAKCDRHSPTYVGKQITYATISNVLHLHAIVGCNKSSIPWHPQLFSCTFVTVKTWMSNYITNKLGMPLLLYVLIPEILVEGTLDDIYGISLHLSSFTTYSIPVAPFTNMV